MDPHERILGLMIFPDCDPLLFTPELEVEKAKAHVNFDVIGYVDPDATVNVIQDGELKEKATSMKLERPAETGDIDLKALMCAYLTRMEKVVDALEASGFDGIAQEYLRRSVTLNQKVQVIGAQETFIATAKAIDEEGALIVVDENGTERRVLCGDVSVRGLMGYC